MLRRAFWLLGLVGCTEDAEPTVEADAAADLAPAVDSAVDMVNLGADGAVDAALPDAVVDAAVPTVPPCADEDALAPNQHSGQASAIEVGFTRGDLFVCPGVTDHFALPLAAGQRARIELLARPETTDLDLAVDGPDGMEVAYSAGEGGTETVRLVARAAGTYTIRVAGYRGQTAPYSLAVKAGCRFDEACGPEAVCDTITELCVPFTRGACGGDETDDRHETSTELPRQAFEGVVCPQDRDWFHLDMQDGESLEVSVSFTAGRNLDLVALGPEGRLVDAAIADANPERLVLSSVPAGRYRIGVLMPGSGDDAEVPYRLAAVSSSVPCRIARDCRSLGLPVCAATGVCQPAPADGGAKLGGPCGRGSDCPPGADFCFQGDPGGHDNTCTVACETNDECVGVGPASLCARRLGGFQCLAPCDSDDDCSLTRRCEEGNCSRRGRCAQDADCGPGEACLESDFGPACTLVED